MSGSIPTAHDPDPVGVKPTNSYILRARSCRSCGNGQECERSGAPSIPHRRAYVYPAGPVTIRQGCTPLTPSVNSNT